MKTPEFQRNSGVLFFGNRQKKPYMTFHPCQIRGFFEGIKKTTATNVMCCLSLFCNTISKLDFPTFKPLKVGIMKQENYSARFFALKNKPLKNGDLPIVLRVTINGVVEEVRIQRSISPKVWNQPTGRCKGKDRQSLEINDYLQELDSKLFQIYREFSQQQAYFTPKTLIQKLFTKEENVRTVLHTFKEQIDEIYNLIGIDYEKITWRRYDVCFRCLQEVIRREFKKEDITFFEFDRSVIHKLKIYLKTERELCQNTFVRYMKCVKKLTNVALANDWLKKDPFIGLRYKEPETQPLFLTMEELEKVKTQHFNIERLSIVRDAFIFCCFTGLAFSDAKELRKEHILSDNNGKLWIRKDRTKMKRNAKRCTSEIPLMQTAIDILNKYKDHPKCQSKGLCLPLYSNQKMNDYLKEIASFCMIDKAITTHTAIHTFATTVALGNNVSLKNVSKMLGHTSSRMTEHYARVIDQNILQDMELAERRMNE